jgi:DNA repair protein RecO (recombination protein O)
MMSVLVEAQGVVLRTHRYGETSRIVVFLTPAYGKVHAVAKGARSPRNPFGAALDLLAHAHLVFYLKPDRELQLVSSAALLDAHEGLLAHPVRFHYGCAIVEFADRLIYGMEPSPEAFALVLATLKAFQEIPEERLGAVFKAYQLRLAALVGYRPGLEGCLRCPRPGPGRLAFGIREGGLLCGRHARGREDLIPLDPEALAVLRGLVGGGGEWRPGHWSPASDQTVARVVEAFLRFHIPTYRGLRSLKSLRELQRDLHRGRLAGTPPA